MNNLAQRAAENRRAALASLTGVKSAAIGRRSELWAAARDNKKLAKQREQEHNLTSSHHLDLFVTPHDLAARMVSICDDITGAWLEPSAGTGRIAQAMRDAGYTPHCVEFSYDAVEYLKNQGFDVEHSDFLTWKGSGDAIIMNPPFSRGQDMEHVQHAYTCLNEGGRIVAIMSEGPFFRQDKKATAFREWLYDVGYSEKLPEGTFKQSGTGVNTRMVIIDK